MDNVKNILVAVDLGESSAPAFAEARELATRLGAALHLLCVVQDPFSLPWAPTADQTVLTTLLAQLQQDAKAYLERLLPAPDRERLRAEIVVRVGRRPSTEILAYAAAKKIDLLVVGKDGHGSPEAATEASSVAVAVVHGAGCPVLVVPAHATTHRVK